MLLCVLLCGMVTRPGGVAARLGPADRPDRLPASSCPTMFFLGAVFAALWWASVHYGRKVDEAKARFAAQQAEASRQRLTLRDVPGRPEPLGPYDTPCNLMSHRTCRP